MKTRKYICLAIMAKQSGLTWQQVGLELRLAGVPNPVPFIGIAKAVLDIRAQG